MSQSDDSLPHSLAELVILLILLSIWLTIKYIEAVVKAWMLNPQFKPLWLAAGVAIVMTILAYLTNFQEPIIAGLYSLAHLMLFVMAKAMDVYYDNYVQKEVTKESVVDQVKHGPWWAPQPKA